MTLSTVYPLPRFAQGPNIWPDSNDLAPEWREDWISFFRSVFFTDYHIFWNGSAIWCWRIVIAVADIVDRWTNELPRSIDLLSNHTYSDAATNTTSVKNTAMITALKRCRDNRRSIAAVACDVPLESFVEN